MPDKPAPTSSVFVGLDKAILRETQRERAVTDAQPEEQANQQTSKPDSQLAGKPANQPTAPTPQAGTREASSLRIKATYRLRPEAIDALEESRRVLRRDHGLKVTREQIVEVALVAAYDDLTNLKTASSLASQFSGKPASQQAGRQDKGGSRKENG